MFRSLILASVAAVGVAIPLSLPATADAHPRGQVVAHREYHRCAPERVHVHCPRPVPVCPPRPVVVCPPRPVVVCPPRPVVCRGIVETYHVQYRHCASEPWTEYGAYQFEGLARGLAKELGMKGFETQVLCH
jgi:hypothetical protein